SSPSPHWEETAPIPGLTGGEAVRHLVARWTEGSRRIQGVGDADADGELHADGELGNTCAAGAWEIATALADCAPGHAPTRRP
ncbi:MAG TPA: hypothetical protein VFY14_00820, partial [Streptomyces sp.]|nr:hypothetical protein [Streptomyces sp.]